MQVDNHPNPRPCGTQSPHENRFHAVKENDINIVVSDQSSQIEERSWIPFPAAKMYYHARGLALRSLPRLGWPEKARGQFHRTRIKLRQHLPQACRAALRDRLGVATIISND
jgi:hypothetical protein